MSSGMSRAHVPMLARSFSWTRWFHELMPIPPWPQQFPELNHFIRPGHELMAWLRMHWSSSCFFTSFYLVEKLEWFMSWLNFDVEHALNGWAHEFLIKSSKIRGGFCRVCGGFCRVRGGFGRASISGQSITMLNIKFRSRVFSSDSLMDGEAILANQVFDDMDVAALEAELNRLKDRFLGFVAVVVVAVVIVLVVIVSFNGLWVYRLFLFLVLSDARQSTNFGGAAFFSSFWTLKCLKNGTFKKWGMLSTGTFPWMRVSKLIGASKPFSRPWIFF